ncbi:transcriptional regulator [Candidatus Woesebacteria bacterium RIFOXYC1_FULL_46_16]|uniref:Transcriptional regulator n=1 Tax=Candidatus Woesebacteria bacterium RIFOXYC1_FULL_46_16 TaxID=1802546 RepID=A0A1F8D961_9BACT|nr:MAG: transcriptional regulator [Candidatus Woesebacteria bacterium RIFOXYC1_FULL_46_16]
MEEWNKVKKELLKNKEAYKEYKRLEPKYRLISQLIGARIKKGLTQKQLAERIGTKQSAVARIESGNANPSLDFLKKITSALGSELIVQIK